ncbi:hypothetical protein NE237_018677 [Protea cynaroides]|uniref:Uncharacterized protein n=1 Tax=Protea cynaroides TaxID=273540 RepID=A0A9Q0KAB6_9MAGN|nr:hypothetical protein NE237_018677 [Protea cynaroides]
MDAGYPTDSELFGSASTITIVGFKNESKRSDNFTIQGLWENLTVTKDIELLNSFWTYEVEYGEVEQASGLKKKSKLLTCSNNSFWAKTDLLLGIAVVEAYFQLGIKAYFQLEPKPTKMITVRNYNSYWYCIALFSMRSLPEIRTCLQLKFL